MSFSSPETAGPSAIQPSSSAPAPVPLNIHERVFIIWVSIFPLVAICLWTLAPLMVDWHPVLRAFALTIVIVPVAGYLVVPRVTNLYLRLTRRQT
ncbi:MAG: hypothetical protein HOQ07_05820 [Sinomonas sp.]|nr:hypothetical protein [Sinomonas sp.]